MLGVYCVNVYTGKSPWGARTHEIDLVVARFTTRPPARPHSGNPVALIFLNRGSGRLHEACDFAVDDGEVIGRQHSAA